MTVHESRTRISESANRRVSESAEQRRSADVGIYAWVIICFIICGRGAWQMQNIKVAVSIPRSLFEQAEDLARRMNISRSRLFALALEDYIRRQQNRELLAQINAAYADEPDLPERTLRQEARRTHRRIVEGEW